MVPALLPLLLVSTVAELISAQQLISPCPRFFNYEPRGAENDRWYGTVTLLSESDLNGVWLRLVFDKPSIQLGNWFGEVNRKSDSDYLVKNSQHKLAANTPYNLRFYVRYGAGGTPPTLVSIRLNGKTVCPEGGATIPPPEAMGQLITSSELSTTSQPLSQRGPGGNFGLGGGDDDIFQGDFALIHSRPQINNKDNVNVQSDFDAPCGTVVMSPRPLITHGQATHEGEFPWHVALYLDNGVDLSYICGASLITKIHVITVAHCVTRRKSQTPLSPDLLIVYVGKYYLKSYANAALQERRVERITAHPKFNAQAYANDIAIIKLDSPVEITNYVRPVCLWEESPELQSVIHKVGTVVGWGFDENGKITDKLNKAKMPVVAQETCIYSFPDFYSRFTSPTTYCAGFQNGTSVCNGDSGGGMVFPKSNSNPNNPVWQLRGLVSISVALQNRLRCDSSHYVVFTDVAKYLNWIRASLN